MGMFSDYQGLKKQAKESKKARGGQMSFRQMLANGNEAMQHMPAVHAAQTPEEQQAAAQAAMNAWTQPKR